MALVLVVDDEADIRALVHLHLEVLSAVGRHARVASVRELVAFARERAD